MSIFTKDGMSLVPELMEQSTLRSNVLPAPVIGRDAIGAVLQQLEHFYHGIVDLERTANAAREIIVSRARLSNGEAITITIVGIRDSEGWIDKVIMTHTPEQAATALAECVAAIRH